MRFPSARLIRLGSVTRGSIAEPGDAELQLPPVLQPTIELSSPIDKVLTAPVGSLAVPAQDSFFAQVTTILTGVGGPTQPNICFLDRGAWSLDLSFSGAFTGTTNTAKSTSLNIVDPDGAGFQIVILPFITPITIARQSTFRFVFQLDGWRFNMSTSATVALETHVFTASINARKSV